LLFILFICTDHQVCHLHCHQSSSPLDQVQWTNKVQWHQCCPLSWHH
jgi:hypothetical protein